MIQTKRWKVPLPDGFSLICTKTTAAGKWLNFAVVLRHGDDCVTRYDSADGAPHRDVLGRREGLIRKEWHESFSLQNAFEHGIRDLSANYAKYYEYFTSH